MLRDLLDLQQNLTRREQNNSKIKRPKKHLNKSSEHTKRYQNEVDSWARLVAIVTGKAALQACSHPCMCTKSTETLPALSLHGMYFVMFLRLKLSGYETITFDICSNDCPLRNGMLGFISKGYYPSSPLRPRFAIHNDILFLFNEMYMRGPSSKHVYAMSIRSLVQSKTEEQVIFPWGSC